MARGSGSSAKKQKRTGMEADMKVRIFTMTHKKFNPPTDEMYVPLHVGRAGSSELGYTGDDTGENISRENCYYGELTGIYWLWKNYKEADYIGVCHYRRYLINEEGRIFTERELLEIFKEYDIVTTRKVKLECSYLEGFGGNHNVRDLICTGEVIKEKYPDYYGVYEKTVNSEYTYFGNIMVLSKELFDEYSKWLFDIFFEVQKRIDIESYDDYHKRVFGFISEMLLLVWVNVKGLKAYECKVGMTVEKAETREMKERLAEYFRSRDAIGAKDYFMESLKRRPDVLMEASDITGELTLAMQVTATADIEKRYYGHSVLDKMNDFNELIGHFRELNRIAGRRMLGKETSEDETYIKLHDVSETAMEIARMTAEKEHFKG